MEPIPSLSPPPCTPGCPSPKVEGMSSLPPLADLGTDSVQDLPIMDLPPITDLGSHLKGDDTIAIMPLPPCTAVDSPLVSKATPRLPEQQGDSLPIMSLSPDLASQLAEEDSQNLV